MKRGASEVLTKSVLTGAGVAFGIVLAQACSTLEVEAPYLPFLPGIVMSSLLGGLRLGAVATLLSGGSLRFCFVKPCYSLALPGAADALHLLLFLAVALLICYAIDKLMRSNDALSRDNFALGHKVFLLLRDRRDESAPLIPTSPRR